MNYIAEINAFYEIFLPQNPISANAQALWHRLMAYCSKFGWKENFTLVNGKLIEEVGFHTSTESKDSNDSAADDEKKEKDAKTRAFERARNTLIQKGLIKYKKGSGSKCGSYTMISIAPPKKESDFVVQPVAQSVAQPVVQPVAQKVDSVLPLDKLNYTKLNETKENDTTHARVREECVSDRFDEFWKAYPKKTAKDTARKAFAKIKPDDELLQTMLDAIDKQKQSQQWTKDAGQYIPNPATWLNQKRWEDEIVVDNNQKPDFSDVSRYDDLTMDFKKE